MTDPNKPNEETQPKKMHSRRHIIIWVTLVFSIIALLCLIYWVLIGRFYKTTDDAYVSGNLVQLMPQISGTVTNIQADDTHLVLQGQPVIQLDPSNARIALQAAIANLANVVRQTKQLYENVSELEASVAISQTNVQRLQADYDRRIGLIASKAVSREELQHAKDALITQEQQLKLTEHQLYAAKAIVINSDLYHHPNVLGAEATLRDAYLNWQRTTLVAPATGYVAKRSVQVGQQVNPGTVLLNIVPLNEIWVDANFKESQLENVRINQPARVVSDFYGRSVIYRGRVVGLGAGTGSTFALLPPQNATGNWIKIVQRLPVRIVLDPEQFKRFPLRIGLSMTVTIDTHDRTGPALAKVAEEKVIYGTDVYLRQLRYVNDLIDKIVKSNATNIELKNNSTSISTQKEK